MIQLAFLCFEGTHLHCAKRFCLQWIAQSDKAASICVGQAFQQHPYRTAVKHGQTAFQVA